MSEEENKDAPEECFVIMPISDQPGYEEGHFSNVYNALIRPACEKAGYNPIRADEVVETNLIHLDILKRVVEAPMAICDLSSRNPNVLFELGIRQAFDKPVVLIQDQDTPRIFDISILRAQEYRKELKYLDVPDDQEAIKNALLATKEATEKNTGINSIVQLLSLDPGKIKDVNSEDNSAILSLILSEIKSIRTNSIIDQPVSNDITKLHKTVDSRDYTHLRKLLTTTDKEQLLEMLRKTKRKDE